MCDFPYRISSFYWMMRGQNNFHIGTDWFLHSITHSITFWDYSCACRHCCVLWYLTNLLSSSKMCVLGRRGRNCFVIYWLSENGHHNQFILNFEMNLNLNFKLKRQKSMSGGFQVSFYFDFLLLLHDSTRKIFCRFSSATTTTGVWEMNV